MEKVIDAFRQNLQLAHEKAKACDLVLDGFAEKGLGKFQAIFPKDSGFQCEANRVVPYVEELAKRFLEATGNGTETKIEPAKLTELAKLLNQIFALEHQLEQTAAAEVASETKTDD
ncbi:hypothetical protein HR060_00255 [Catenovulum sp. SM1970]|uniref:hypothetical protein n=1 Tax=Marinifaba aquimaris TaxID=2741323 RepID=UPI001571FAF5|nr:hypothetical protein [Marinifaba aquimaris]NTS75280.1 hypothetical protein [Marinifaba aquimaris]